MTKKYFISIIPFGLSLIQIIIYILDCASSNTNMNYNILNYSINNLSIINIDRKYFRFLNFFSYSNGDMVFLTTSISQTYLDITRIFYGLKENGRRFFNDSYFFSTEIDEYGSYWKFESENLVIRESINTSDKK